MPGTIDNVVIPALERTSGKRSGEGFAALSNPEFLREGTSIKDFYEPPFTLIGAHADQHANSLCKLYRGITAPLHIVPVRVAEMVKYASNCYHGVKVVFANEIGNVCKALGVDSHEVMRLFAEDRKLNISAAYLKPGFAFGGSCLPKDIRAVVYKGKELDVPTPLLSAALESNQKQIDRAFDMVMAAGSRRIGILGLAFKSGTDDLRESPMVALIEKLIGKGMQLAIYDSHVASANIIGANKEFVEQEIPHIWSLMHPTVASVVRASETIVVGNSSREFGAVGYDLAEGQVVIDLARAFGTRVSDGAAYQGICW